MTRQGDWIQTYSERQFYPLDPRPEEIHIEDIGHALSNICRFGGHCRQFYSVAQHSCRVADFFLPDRPELAMWGLLHDAPEAYLGDMVRPLKHWSGDWGDRFVEAEGRLMEAVVRRFKLTPVEIPSAIKEVDDVMLLTEVRDLMGDPDWARVQAMTKGLRPDSTPIAPVPPLVARNRFMTVFRAIEAVRYCS